MRWLSAINLQAIDWLLTIGWLSAIYWLTKGWLQAGYQLSIGWLCPKINTLQDNHILCTKMVHGCYQYFGLVCSQDFLAGYVPKSIHFRTQSYAMYQSGTWLLSMIWTAVCSQEFLAISRLLVGYVAKSIHFKPSSYTMY